MAVKFSILSGEDREGMASGSSEMPGKSWIAAKVPKWNCDK